MENDLKIRCRQFLEDFTLVEEFSKSGIDEPHLKISCTPLRKWVLEDEIVKLWHLVGMTKQPKINAPFLDKKLLNDGDTVLIAGGEDSRSEVNGKDYLVNPTPEQIEEFHNSHKPHPLGLAGPVAMIALHKNGDISYQRLGSNYSHSVTSNYQIPEEVVTDRELGFSTYTESIVIVWNGEKIQRRHIVKYVAYNLGVMHGPSNSSRLDQSKAIVLDKFYNTQLDYKNVVLYTFQSIAQQIVGSPDIQLLVDTCRELINSESNTSSF